MASLPFISICIPAYKRPEALLRLLSSLSSQTFCDYEIIITDDTPGNEVKDVVSLFNQKKVHYFKNEVAAGSPKNWNIALSKATGKWVHLLHADDWYADANALEHFVKVAKEGAVDFIFCASKEINQLTGSVKEMVLNEKKKMMLDDNPVNLLFENVIGHPSTVIFKKDTAINFDPGFKWVVDIDFYIRYLQQHKNYFYISEPLINVAVDSEQVSNNCYKNPFVEIPEYLNLFNKFPAGIALQNKYAFYCLWNLVKKFNISDWGFIVNHGYNGKKIVPVEEIIHFQKKIPRLLLKQTAWSQWLMNFYFKKIKNNSIE